MEDTKTPATTTDAVPEVDMPTEDEYTVKEQALTPFEGDYMDVTVDVADHIAKYEKAVDTIMNFIIRRCYPGDFVSHDKMSTPLEDRKVNISGAAAERIARDLGITESNRTKPKKVMHEKRPGHYYYECEGDFSFRGRKIHAIGMASTVNPFYSRAYEKDIPPENIREEYIMREAWRDCMKQAIKMLFGIRGIPIGKLRDLGYDTSKVKFVNFKENAASQSAKNPEATAKPKETDAPVADAEQYVITIENMTAKTSKKGTAFYSVHDVEGGDYFAWGSADSKLIMDLIAGWKASTPISVMIKGGQYPTIVSVVSK